MRRVLFLVYTGVLVGGCAATDTTGPLSAPSEDAALGLSPTVEGAEPTATASGILDDAIDRLAPALGPRGAALGAPLRHLRDGGRLDAPLIDAALRQLAALSKDLPSEIAPDADALEFALLALRAAAEN